MKDLPVTNRQPSAQQAAARKDGWPLYRPFIHGVAAVAIIIIVWVFLLIWPIPLLGYTYDLITAHLVAVEPGSPADQAGVREGDRLIALYGRSWEEVKRDINTLRLIGPLDRPVPVVVERDGVLLPLAIPLEAPAPEFQLVKLTHLGLAVLCWLTGYLLGIARQGQAGTPRVVVLFWFAIGVLVVSYLFAIMASLPIRLVLQWLMLTVLIPLAIYVHTVFPGRGFEPSTATKIRRWFWFSVFGLNLALLVVVLVWKPSLEFLILTFSTILPVAVLVAFLASGGLLFTRYRRTVSAHHRRQIRLIAMACLIVATGWILFLIIPLALGDDAQYTNQASNGVTALLPLAYLLSGLTPDLFRLERITRRLASHLLTVSVMVSLIACATQGLAMRGEVLLLTVTIAAVTLYRPGYRLFLRLLGEPAPGSDYRPLARATSQFAASLDPPILVQACLTGVRGTFAQPALALYLGNGDRYSELSLVAQEHLPSAPCVLPTGTLTNALAGSRAILEGRELERRLGSVSLTTDEAEFLHQPGVVLWCPICHSNGFLLALLLLGPRGDQDQYRSQDIHELQTFCDAAALAFAHGTAYQQLEQAEALARELSTELEAVQQKAGAQQAMTLHEDIINGVVSGGLRGSQNL